MNMEVMHSPKMSVGFQWTACYIPEDRALHNHPCEKLTSYSKELLSLLFNPEDGGTVQQTTSVTTQKIMHKIKGQQRGSERQSD
jgi:hypothetical protein